LTAKRMTASDKKSRKTTGKNTQLEEAKQPSLQNRKQKNYSDSVTSYETQL